MIPVIYEGELRSDRVFFSGPIQPNPRNPIMSEKPLMPLITPRAMLSFNSLWISVTPSDYQCPYKAEMFSCPSVLETQERRRVWWMSGDYAVILSLALLKNGGKNDSQLSVRHGWCAQQLSGLLVVSLIKGRNHQMGCEVIYIMWTISFKLCLLIIL